MGAVAEHDVERKVAVRQTIALLNLTPKQKEHFEELAGLYQKSSDEGERAEILEVALEMLRPNGVGAVGNLDAGVSEATRTRVNAYHREVGRAIRKKRRERGMSQAELAQIAGLPQSHVSRLECGKHTPTHVTINKLAKALRTRAKMLDPGFDD